MTPSFIQELADDLYCDVHIKCPQHFPCGVGQKASHTCDSGYDVELVDKESGSYVISDCGGSDRKIHILQYQLDESVCTSVYAAKTCSKQWGKWRLQSTVEPQWQKPIMNGIAVPRDGLIDKRFDSQIDSILWVGLLEAWGSPYSKDSICGFEPIYV